MTWNHRVMRRTYPSPSGDEIIDEIYEVYYKPDGTVDMWTDDPVSPSCYVNMEQDENWNTIRKAVEIFAKACDKPTLDYETGKELDTEK